MNGSSGLQFVHVAGGDGLAVFDALYDFDQIAVGRAGLDDALDGLAVLDDENFTQPGHGHDGALRDHYGGRVRGSNQPRFGEHARSQQIARVGDFSLDGQRASLFVERRADADDAPRECPIWKSVNGHVDRLPGPDGGDRRFGDVCAEPERIDLDQRDDLPVDRKVGAARGMFLFHGAADRRADDGVGERLFGERQRGFLLLDGGELLIDQVERRLVARLREVVVGHLLVVARTRNVAFLDQLHAAIQLQLRPIELGFRHPYVSVLIRVEFFSLLHPQPGHRLFECGLGLFDLELRVALVDRRDDLALRDVTAEIDVELLKLARGLRRDDDLFVGGERTDGLHVTLQISG